VHYLDFDRALHWLRVAPRELRAVLRVALRHPALVIGRSEQAHASHHRPLWATEVVANRLMADQLGVRGRFDLLAPSFVLTADATRVAASLACARRRVYGSGPRSPVLAPRRRTSSAAVSTGRRRIDIDAPCAGSGSPPGAAVWRSRRSGASARRWRARS
jgi:hypothetical protein